ncbi:MAG: hypothetical protein A3J54_02360 [Candidatus Ryanbacteria bacterium RIFCSPHIGHO2_02_FULL_45_13b]|uniref:Glycosyltransferase RgtA/B/C/D-like domain-containing protein n=1 Tax=Candidatus Ryanbacteria bacterium RIFCSPHIGHO2_02_FULL_45_13b TaxID=1802117 RepID=A0A1G2GB34_9BACT|nr:MAG: hypothetical protein A3J54_02360 [Candidatus Ryanbacteria bacterium RIFCSPHIGHO2_02_FULL_45_13b]
MEDVYMFFQKRRTETVLFCTAFLLRAGVFLLFFSLASSSSSGFLSLSAKHHYPDIGADSGGYISTAHVLLEEGRFASPGESDPQSYLMPGYPLLLAFIFSLGGDLPSVIVLQALLAGFSAVLVYYIGRHIAPMVGLIAAWIFVFDPISIFYSTTILTETFFMFLIFLTVWVFLHLFKGAWGGMVVVGLLTGLSVYVRPNAIMFPLVFILILLVWKDGLWTWKQTILRCAVLGTTAFLVVFPWMLRNKIIFDTWDLTAVATIQWYWYNAPLYYAHTQGITHNEALAIFRERLFEINPHKSDEGTLRNAPYMRQVAFEYLREDPWGYAWFHVVKSIPFFISDGLRDIARRMGLVGEQPNIGNLVLKGDFRAIQVFFSEHTLAVVFLAGGVIFWSMITVGMIVGMIAGHMLSIGGKRVLYVSVGIVFGTMLIAAGPNASARYRLSISPFMFIAASYGLLQLREWVTYRTIISHESDILET